MKFLLSFLLLTVFTHSAFAEGSDRESAQFFDSVMSPYCPGMTLSACPSDDARVLRDEIRGQFAQGISKEQILVGLNKKFGNLSGGPSGGAMGGMTYLGILVFFVIGLGIIMLNIRKSGKGNNVEAET
jgi:cytochrome c-type biogenesis protein CcmH/NrfF